MKLTALGIAAPVRLTAPAQPTAPARPDAPAPAATDLASSSAVGDAGPGPSPRSGPGDVPVLVALACVFTALAAVTWRRWGVPEIDAGAELTTASMVAKGALPYHDVRYFYGPLGLYSLALAFKVFGTSFTTAFAFGLAQTAAILAAFYALARQWLRPLTSGLASVVLLAIGFSGTAFNFVLPHTNSATFGVLALLLMLLALARERLLAAGVACGAVGLTRPEFLAVALATLAAFVLARWRTEGRSAALAAAWRLALPGIAIPVAVLGWFAARAGVATLFTENLWPVKFVRVGAKTEASWMPVSASAALGLLARGAIYGGLLAALVVSVEGWRRRRGPARVLAVWPLLAAALALALLDGALRAGGALGGQRHAIELEARHLMLGMSWLPALGFAAVAYAAVRLVRRESAPLGRGWPVDLALIVAAAALGLRAYNAFTTAGSYAPYYAAPLVLLAAIAHERLATRRPQARVAVLAVLGLVAAGLAAYAVGGLYRHDNTLVRTPRGSFLTTAAAAPALEATVRRIDALTAPGEPILAAPSDGGLYFMADRPPALYEVMLLPGLVYSRAEERAAIVRLQRERVRLAVVAARDFGVWGTPTFGVDYDPLLGAYLRGHARSSETIGELRQPAGGTNPSRGFTLLRLG